MRRRGRDNVTAEVNPYIALSDLVIAVLLIVVFFVALGQLGLANLRYRRAMDDFADKVRHLPTDYRPYWEKGRNDTPGTQRWVFSGQELFEPTPLRGLRDPLPPQRLTAKGKKALDAFSRLLRENLSQYRRIRVEGHTQPPSDDTADDWELSAARAIAVARRIQREGRIPAHFLAVAGRAGQNHLYRFILFYNDNDLATTPILQTLNASGATYSRRDAVRDPAALRDYKKWRLARLPALLLLDSNEKGREIATSDSKAFAEAIALWHENDRVEVLAEYSQNPPGADASVP